MDTAFENFADRCRTVSAVEFTDVVRRRRMVHVFDRRPVDSALIDQLIDLARRGPSAGYSQGTDFLVLDDPDALGQFWALTDDPEFPRTSDEAAAGPPVVVLAFADPARYVRRYSEPDKIAFGLDRPEAWRVRFWDTDTAMACMLLLLAAVDAGLGGWLFGVDHGIDDLFRTFNVPGRLNLVAAVGIGYAGVDENPRGSAFSRSRRPLEDVIHRNRW
jgi:nitroreductase